MKSKGTLLLALLLLVAMMASFAEGGQEAAAATPAGPVTVEFWHAMTGKNGEILDTDRKSVV